jgi:hypothetical protein
MRKKGMVTLRMATEKDHVLVQFLKEETENGKINWEPTAENDQFTASFKGKYSATIDMTNDGADYSLVLTDTNGRVLLRLNRWEDQFIEPLFHEVRRRALNVDAAIDEIMGGDRDDLPI